MTNVAFRFDPSEDNGWVWDDCSVEQLLHLFSILRETKDPRILAAGEFFDAAANEWDGGKIGNTELIRCANAVIMVAGFGTTKTYATFAEAYQNADNYGRD
jgi:hypothetical protein